MVSTPVDAATYGPKPSPSTSQIRGVPSGNSQSSGNWSGPVKAATGTTGVSR